MTWRTGWLSTKKVTTQNLRRLCRLGSAKQREEKRQEILDAKLEDSGLFHRLINRQRGGQRQCVNELHVDEKTFHTEEGILEGFREHFQMLATPCDVPGFDRTYGNLVQSELAEIIELCRKAPDDQPRQYVTCEQVEKAIASLNRGKAADYYGVTAEHFLFGGEELLSVTTEIINNLYKYGEMT